MPDKIIETKHCKQCGTSFDISEKDKEFYHKVSPVFAGKKYPVPPADICSECNQKSLQLTRNERKLYKRKCDLTGKDMLSVYSPESPYKVFYRSERRTDKWDALDYGQEIDFVKPLFQQIRELSLKVPRYNLYNFDTENCEFVQYVPHSKDCYLCFGSTKIEKSYYGSLFMGGKNNFDGLTYRECENCYECVNIQKCYQVFYSLNCANCSQSSFLYDCLGCDNCIGCRNLRNKSYHIFDQPVSKEAFEEKKKEIFTSHTSTQKFFQEFLELVKSKAIHKYYIGEHNENVTGSYLFDCKNCKNIYFGTNCEEVSNTYRVYNQKDSQYMNGCTEGSLVYKSISCDGAYKIVCSKDCEECTNLLYCDVCDHCQDCFACVGLKNKQYCILNKQYAKTEYEELVPKIITKMIADGERTTFDPALYCSYAYNETVAQEYFPLTPEDAKKKGYAWREGSEGSPSLAGMEVIAAQDVPDTIEEVQDDILQKALLCEVTGKPFKIIKPELEFYRKYHLSLPRRHPDQRHQERMNLRNPRQLRERKCAKCGIDIKTSYAPERPEMVYCEACYNREIYG